MSIYSEALKIQQAPSTLTFDKEQERVVVHFAKPLPASSKARLQVSFRGKLTSSMQGYYKSSWEHEGKKKDYALTQFEVRKNASRSVRLINCLIHSSDTRLQLLGVRSLAGTNRCLKRHLL